MGLAQDIVGFLGAGRAGKDISAANQAAENGVLQSTATGQNAVTGAASQNMGTVNTAQGAANSTIGNSVQGGNATLANTLTNVQGNTQPYTSTGATANGSLANFLTNTPQFSYNQSDYLNSAAQQFQTQSGDQAIQNAASAQGLGASGAALKQMDQYGQGVAAQYENQAFGQAQSTFGTNTATTEQGINMGLQAGEFGAGQADNATLATGGQQSANTMAGGMQQSQNILSPAEFLANEDLSSQEYAAGLGQQGATTAGNFAVNAGLANAGATMGQYNNAAGGIGDVASMLAMFAG